MAWLLFMDESGHDHKHMPLEVRGGIAIHVSKLWDFIRAWQRLELEAFGVRLNEAGVEIKGHKLLDKDRYRWANQGPRLSGDERRKHARAFLLKRTTKEAPTSTEFLAYGQASMEMAQGIFELLASHDANLFAAAIPRGTKAPKDFMQKDYLRKDHVFLFERFFYFLEAKKDNGLLVMDESDKSADRTFVRKIEAYFSNTATGRQRTAWIVPSPLFVASDMSVGVQAADICLYAISWGFRLPAWQGIDPVREEISRDFRPLIKRIEWQGDGYRDGKVFHTHGIVLVPDPFEARG